MVNIQKEVLDFFLKKKEVTDFVRRLINIQGEENDLQMIFNYVENPFD